MAHREDLGDRLHRQAFPVGRLDGLIPLGSQPLGGFLQLPLTRGVLPGKGRQAGSGLG